MESGAADKVVRRFLAVFGEKPRRAWRWSTGSYFLSHADLLRHLLHVARAAGAGAAAADGQRLHALCARDLHAPGAVTHSLVRAASRAARHGRNSEGGPRPGPSSSGMLVGIIPAAPSAGSVSKWLNRRLRRAVARNAGHAAGRTQGHHRTSPRSELPSFAWPRHLCRCCLPIAR